MKVASLLVFLCVFSGLHSLSGCCGHRKTTCDWTAYRQVATDLGLRSQTIDGVCYRGSGASAPGGVIRGWLPYFYVFGEQSTEEALKLLLRIREEAQEAFEANPQVLAQMDPDYTNDCLFEIEIEVRNPDWSLPPPDKISIISLKWGTVTICSGEEMHPEVFVRESYADFLARFPDTTLKATRDG